MMERGHREQFLPKVAVKSIPWGPGVSQGPESESFFVLGHIALQPSSGPRAPLITAAASVHLEDVALGVLERADERAAAADARRRVLVKGRSDGRLDVGLGPRGAAEVEGATAAARERVCERRAILRHEVLDVDLLGRVTGEGEAEAAEDALR